jgi:hypothetical protein
LPRRHHGAQRRDAFRLHPLMTIGSACDQLAEPLLEWPPVPI